uniref:EOG090X0N2I n=1 Tax=Evadne anonyx TaxID=141404 RepID=A0A9N6ZFP1_9CRUS|nr:EOG090X0N2I [Evadne anonyx]
MENTNLFKEMNSIPLADDDPQAVIPDDSDNAEVERDPSLDSMSSRFTNDSLEQQNSDDINLDEQEEKARLISQVMELQNTLDDLSQRVDSVKEENLKLKSENQVLGQYIENLMAASSVFQSTSPRVKKK